MDIKGIIWLDEIVDKLNQKHHVIPAEVREVLQGRPLVRYMNQGSRQDENVYCAFGRSSEGRYLMVFFVLKKNKRALILSARDMTDKERGYYGKKSKTGIVRKPGHSSNGSTVTLRYKEMGEFWDTHDATDFIEESKNIQVNVRIESEVTYCALDNALRDRLQKAAVKHGVSSDTLVNMWVQDKLETEHVH